MSNKIRVIEPTDAIIDDKKHLITVKSGDVLEVTLANTEGIKEEDLEEIQWIASTFNGKPDDTKVHAGLKGKTIRVRVQDEIAGGGLCWLEPVLKGEQPKHIPPYGYFYNTEGKRSIDRIEWLEMDGKTIITKSSPKFFTEGVQLHIYTTGLYGHDIQVMLKDINWVDYELDLDEDIKDAKNTLAKFFSREVKYYDKAGSEAQKVIIDVRLELSWMGASTSHSDYTIQIIPIISSKVEGVKVNKKIKENYITVRKHKENDYRTLQAATKTGNKPTIIGDIVTDPADFSPCFYSKIEATYKKDKEENKATLFDESISLKPKRMSMAVVAGPRHARREVKLKLDTDLNYCEFIGNEALKHETRVFDFSKIEDAIIISSSKPSESQKETDKKKLSIMDSDDLQHEDGKMEEDNVYLNLSMDTIIGGTGGHAKKAWDGPTRTYTKTPESDTEVTVEVPFIYGDTDKNETILNLVKYIWPAAATPQTYPIYLHTCRYPSQLINIDVYPDVKWTLQFCYNTDPEEFNKVREKYKEYQVRLEEVDADAKENYDDKINRNEDLAEKYEDLADEIKKNKKKTQKEIDKLERKIEGFKKSKKKDAIKELAALNKKQKSLNSQQEKYKNKKKNYEKKVEKNKDDKKKYTKKGKKKASKDPKLSKYRPDLYDFEDNLEHGISDIKLSLWAEWDYPAEKFELTTGYKKYVETLKTILKFKKLVDDIFGGKKNNDKTNKKIRDKEDEEDTSAKLIALKLAKAFAPKKLASVNIIPPSIAIAGSWYAENPKTAQQNQIGTNIELNAILDPIVGAEIVLNFMALVEKSHPLVKVALAVMELGGVDIRLDLTITGKLFFKGNFTYNTATGENNIMPGDLKELKQSEDDAQAPMEIGGSIDMEVYAGIKYTIKYEAWSYEALIELGAFVSVTTAITVSGSVEWVQDSKEPDEPDGIYLSPKLKFYGLTMNVAAKGSGEFGEKGKPPIAKVGAEVGGEFIIMDKFDKDLDFKIPLMR